MPSKLPLAALVLAGAAWAGIPAPKLNPGDLPQPLPRPFVDTTDVAGQIDAALTQAKREHKRVLIDFGGNWCPDCRMLAGVMTMPKMREFLDAHYKIVIVDVGHFDKNMDVAKQYGANAPTGVPMVLILSADGKVLNGPKDQELDNDRSWTPQSIADWLASWAG